MSTSTACGSLTLTIMSDCAKTAAASGRIEAPWEMYSASEIAEPSPAPAWTTTSWPCSTSSRTPEGVSATRYSSVLISVGTPTFIWSFRRWSWSYELTSAQGEPEVDAIAGRVQRPARELLHAADAVAERVAMAVELPRGALPLAVALDERLERAHQLAAVGALAVLDRREDRVAEQPQRLVVLEREQQLEGTEVVEGGHRPRRAVAGQLAGLERAARLVERPAGVTGRRRAARAGDQLGARVARDPQAHPLRELEQLLVAALRGREQRARKTARAGDQARRRLVAHRSRERVLDGALDLPRRGDHDHAHVVAAPQRPPAARGPPTPPPPPGGPAPPP